MGGGEEHVTTATRNHNRVARHQQERPPFPRLRVSTLLGGLVAMAALIGIQFPSLHTGFWSWDWYWIDQHTRGRTAWGGPFYDLAHHENPMPVEVAWYRLALTVLAHHDGAHHVLTLGGFLLTLAVLYAYLRLIDLPRWAAAGATILAGLAPSAQTSWTWFAASPHMWATALGLASAVAHVTWRRGGSRSSPLIIGSGVLALAAVSMKNDGAIGPLLIMAWEWTAARSELRFAARARITVLAALPLAAFLWWQATAVDPHRDSAEIGVGRVLSTMAGLIRFAFLARTDAELRRESPPGPHAPTILLLAGAAVGAAVLALALVSLRTRSGRILVAAGVAGLGPVAVLQPALVPRYALPAVLMFTAAAGAGAVVVAQHRRQPRNPQSLRTPRVAGPATPAAPATPTTPALLATAVAALAAIAVWATLAHHSSGFGAVAVQEEAALLASVQAANLDPGDGLALRLRNSPLDPSTAHLRLLDPSLPAALRSHPITFLGPADVAPPGLRLLTAVRDATGRYTITWHHPDQAIRHVPRGNS